MTYFTPHGAATSSWWWDLCTQIILRTVLLALGANVTVSQGPDKEWVQKALVKEKAQTRPNPQEVWRWGLCNGRAKTLERSASGVMFHHRPAPLQGPAKDPTL